MFPTPLSKKVLLSIAILFVSVISISVVEGESHLFEISDHTHVDELLRDRVFYGQGAQHAQFLYVDDALTIQPETYPEGMDASSLSLITEEALATRFEQIDRLLVDGFNVTHGEIFQMFEVGLGDLVFVELDEGVDMQFTDSFIENLISRVESSVNAPAQDLRVIESTPDVITYAVTEGAFEDGAQLLIDQTTDAIQNSLNSGGFGSEMVVETLSAKIVDESGNELGSFDLLGTGRSYFDRSTPGRDANIRKALNDHYNNILIPPGAEFSFNSFLGDINSSEGWFMAYVIWKGELDAQLGGGICQVSTTVYRAALDAGLEIVDQRGHSLYVNYYEEYGNGLDATIYPGEQDLVFVNNTPGYILIRAYDDGDDAFVEFYGQDDGRVVTYQGPFSNSNQTAEIEEELGGLKYYQLAWNYKIDWPDGTSEEKWLVSSYKSRVKQYSDEDVVDHPIDSDRP